MSLPCLCGHEEIDHESGGSRPCSTVLHRLCGCQVYRPDPRAGSEDAASEGVA